MTRSGTAIPIIAKSEKKTAKASSHGSRLKTAAVLPEFLDSFLKSVVINSSSHSEEIESSVL